MTALYVIAGVGMVVYALCQLAYLRRVDRETPRVRDEDFKRGEN